MKKFMQEFKTFAMNGNVLDMAVGIVIGAAFGSIVASFVNDILMPPIGLLLGGVDFADKVIVLKEAVGTTPPVLLKYGIFINTLINFIIIAFAIFLVIKGINQMKKKELEKPVAPPPPPPPSKQEILLSEIRDLLKK